ncbi:transposase, partial [Thioclava sp. CPCC 100088]
QPDLTKKPDGHLSYTTPWDTIALSASGRGASHRPATGYGHTLRDLRGCTRGHNLKQRFFPTCYGTEFIATKLCNSIEAVGAKTAYVEPRSPWENGYVESYNARLRDELLDGKVFYTLREAQILIERWRQHYNTVRPHSSL